MEYFRFAERVFNQKIIELFFHKRPLSLDSVTV